ncbi:hypothetical protein ABBQ32_010188 [Trebouxia sp. C0010 RCD-2024]
MPLLGNTVGNIIVTGIVTWTLQRRIALATRLLRGLKCYHITAAGADASELVHNTPTQRPSKQQAAKARKRDADLGEAGSVTSMPASIAQIEASAFYSQLDTLLTGSPLNFFPALFATIIIAVALQSLFMVTMATNLSPSFDKWCSLFFALLSGAAAASMLLVAPRGLLNIDTTGATRALSHASASVLSQRGWEPDAQVQHGQGAGVQPVALEVALALLGAVLGGLLLTPIMRIMRSFATALEVPEWATQQLRFPAWLPFSLNLNLMLPALAMIVWVNPLFQEPLGIPQAWMPGIKAGVLTSISLVQLANSRSLVQSYLDTGLKQWHTLKHGSLGRAAAAGTATGAVIKKKLMIVNGLFVKVRLAVC